MDRRVTPPKRVTSPTWGPPPPCKQALNYYRAYAHDITGTILVFQNIKTAAILVYQDNPVGIELFS